MAKKKVLITGGAGFLGCHLARKLLSKGYSVTLLDIAKLDATDLIDKVHYIKCDIRNENKTKESLKGQDFIIHAAAALPIQLTKKSIFSVNIDGTKNVLESSLVNKVKRLIFISSTALYGVPKDLPEKETSPIKPIGYYGVSKLKGENLCKEFMEKGLSINIIRPKTFLGPERLGVFELWFEAIYSGKKVFILGNGKNKYQLLAVSDVVDAIIKAMESKVENETFNIGAKKFGTWNSDIGSVIAFAKSKSKIMGFPVIPSQIVLWILERMHLSPIAEWHYRTIAVNSYVSTTKAENLLKWKARKSNSELLIENYRWYQSHRNEVINRVGTGHRVGWNFKALNLVRNFFN